MSQVSQYDLLRALPPYFDLIAVAGNCPRCGGKGWFTDYGPSHGCDYNCGRCGCGDEIKQQGIGPGTGKIVDTVRSGDLVWRNGWVAAADAEIGQQVSLFDGVARLR